MARKNITRYYDDLDGQPLDADQVVEVRFGYKGRNYVLDVSQNNAEDIDEVLSGYASKATVESAAEASKRRSEAQSSARARNRVIRQWARDNGFDVAVRGAVPKDIIELFETTR